MTVADLVFFKNQLDKLSVAPIYNQANASLNEFLYVVDKHSPENFNKFVNRHYDVKEAFDSFNKEVVTLSTKLKQDIETAEKVLFQQSYSSYHDESIYDAFHILGRRWQPDINLELFYARVRRSVDWHYPAMILRPGYEKFVDEMVGNDPLYLVDVSHKFIEPVLSKFNNHYQQRLRVYTIKEELNQKILGKIPNNQFGMILGCHFFNFRPLEVIRQYLEEIYTKLRPGGVFMMTFNDCDRWSAVKLVEDKKDGSYTPGSLIFELAKTLGYVIDYCWHDEGPQTWIELRKPGVLTSLRGGQSLAKIVSK
jgi:SAM-dependent methyltransferase